MLGLSAASRAAQGTEQAFMDATKYLVSNMLRSMSKKLEIEMFYGQAGYATVSSASGAVLTITTAEWAPGIWAGAEQMPIEVRDSTGATIRGTSNVKSVDITAQTVTLTTAIPGVVNTDVIWHYGAYGNEFIGVHQILTQSSGKLFGIDVGSYNLFRGNSYDAGSAALSFAKLNQAAALAVEKGLDGKLTCFVNPRTWGNMLTDQAALRKYDASYSPKGLENGSEKLTFHSQNGELEIIPSIYCKQGYAYMLCLEEWMRVGSSDISFKRPGYGNDTFFMDSQNQAGYELRVWTDQALFCSAPGKNVVIKGIVNAS